MENEKAVRISLGEGFYIIGPYGPHETYNFKHDEKDIDILMATKNLKFSAFMSRFKRCVDTFMSEESKEILMRWWEVKE